ncbi:MAG: diaminopimelate epimerase [Arenicella sp.]|nr:diaminopimelate epimerase [Arenicella sp.]
MKVPFTKMQALGNDFVVFDCTDRPLNLSAEQAARIADRHLGIGCDQILLVEQSRRPGIDFKYRILNADGSEVGQCGNGARCFLKFVYARGLSSKNPLSVETISGDMQLQQDPETGEVTVNMGVPSFDPVDIPLAETQRAGQYVINKDGDAINFYALSVGNPHAVLIVDDVEHAPVSQIGPVLESHPIFPERTNVGFMQIKGRGEIALRVFERGVGETLACGSGACAAVAAGIHAQKLNPEVTVTLPGGRLSIRWEGEGQPVFMTGPAHTSFEGEIELESEN